MLCANVGTDVVSRCEFLGAQFEELYAETQFPTGQTGAVGFSSQSLD